LNASFTKILVNKYLKNIHTSRQTEFSGHWPNSTKSIFPIWETKFSEKKKDISFFRRSNA